MGRGTRDLKVAVNSWTLKVAREASNLEPAEIAKRVGISLDEYLSYERGEGKPNLSVLKRIANLLNQPAENFISTDLSLNEVLRADYKVATREISRKLRKVRGYKGLIVERRKDGVIVRVISKGRKVEGMVQKLKEEISKMYPSLKFDFKVIKI